MNEVSVENVMPEAAAQAAGLVDPLPVKRKYLSGRVATITMQVLFAIVILATWQILAETKVINPFWTSEPSSVARALGDEIASSDYRTAFYYTLYETMAGFAISVAAGIVSGVLLFEMPLLFMVLRPFITLFNNLPRLVFAPLLVIYLGLGPPSRITLVVSIVYVVVLLNTMAGLRSCDADYLLLAKTMGASRVTTFTKFMLPSAIPSIFVSLQLGLTFSFLAAVVGELMSGGDGLGALLSIDMSAYSFDKVFALLFVMALTATILSGLIRVLERRLLAWRRFEYRRHGGMQ